MLMHSSNLYLIGNCDSLKFETRLSYLIRLETVSHRFSPPSSFFALLTHANVSEELVNSASANLAIRLRGVWSTSLTQPFPSRLGLSQKRSTLMLLSADRLRSFNELWSS